MILGATGVSASICDQQVSIEIKENPNLPDYNTVGYDYYSDLIYDERKHLDGEYLGWIQSAQIRAYHKAQEECQKIDILCYAEEPRKQRNNVHYIFTLTKFGPLGRAIAGTSITQDHIWVPELYVSADNDNTGAGSIAWVNNVAGIGLIPSSTGGATFGMVWSGQVTNFDNFRYAAKFDCASVDNLLPGDH